MRESRNFCRWRKRFVLCPLPPLSFGRWSWDTWLHWRSWFRTVDFECAVSRVRSSLPSSALVPGGEGGFVLVDGAGPSPQGGAIWDTCSGSFTCIRTRLGRGGAHTSSIVSCPGCGRSRSHCTSAFSKSRHCFWHCSHFRSWSPVVV